jgi:stress response protein SCP2
MRISKGQRLKLDEIIPNNSLFSLQGTYNNADITLDFACFGLDAEGLLSDERYMTFFNQPTTPCGSVTLQNSTTANTAIFGFDLKKLPDSIERLVLTAAIDGKATMHAIQSGAVSVQVLGKIMAQFSFTGNDFEQERAVMLMELYRKAGVWRLSATAQGFNGGLDALVKHFGATVEEAVSPITPPPPITNPSRISLEKRLEKEAPKLLSLAKKSAISLAKVGLENHSAKVCLCLDISGSMSRLYKDGLIQAFSERILALGCRFDDDGEIDVFLFGKNVHQPAPMGIGNYATYITHIIQQHPLEGDTRYGRAMQAIRRFYFPDAAGGERKVPHSANMPVYVMFVTDGSTSDQGLTEKQLRWSSHEPIFWQFMGIGKGRKSRSKLLALFADSDFPFLEKLDELPGRLVDNANFFSVESPNEHSDEALYDLMMGEYPDWIKLAKQQGILHS